MITDALTVVSKIRHSQKPKHRIDNHCTYGKTGISNILRIIMNEDGTKAITCPMGYSPKKITYYSKTEKCQVHARYTNIYDLGLEVHISSVLPPEKVYEKMVENDRNLDTVKQLIRRINYMLYHWKNNGEFLSFKLAMEEYIDYDLLKDSANGGYIDADLSDVPFSTTP